MQDSEEVESSAEILFEFILGFMGTADELVAETEERVATAGLTSFDEGILYAVRRFMQHQADSCIRLKEELGIADENLQSNAAGEKVERRAGEES